MEMMAEEVPCVVMNMEVILMMELMMEVSAIIILATELMAVGCNGDGDGSGE